MTRFTLSEFHFTLFTLSERSESKGCTSSHQPFDSALARLAQGEEGS